VANLIGSSFPSHVSFFWGWCGLGVGLREMEDGIKEALPLLAM